MAHRRGSRESGRRSTGSGRNARQPRASGPAGRQWRRL
ncbi:hypothetical protein X805_07120 [Sphaerotilus natans subsp. natans DSM 6575]|uniref:Uncharacterized protein n=1 Tax=Sphaerotilus natans subsp. natans DSM 6575 TaxID=1286631 RepID=A0A059KR75_9BURK|nr:hypothetical protein X805_07120 [Sphaerotilus natans subsp. natans DSM 6575]